MFQLERTLWHIVGLAPLLDSRDVILNLHR